MVIEMILETLQILSSYRIIAHEIYHGGCKERNDVAAVTTGTSWRFCYAPQPRIELKATKKMSTYLVL